MRAIAGGGGGGRVLRTFGINRDQQLIKVTASDLHFFA